jgi:hypothetical protein
MKKIIEVIKTVSVLVFVTVVAILLKTVVCYYIYLWAVYPFSHYEIGFQYMWGIVIFADTLMYEYKSKD